MKSLKYVLAALCFSAMHTAQAVPVAYSFSHNGFADAASISGMFTGDDLDNDGLLESSNGEISGFTLAFTGNTTVGAFSLGQADLIGLAYNMDGAIDDANEGIFAVGSGFGYGTGLAAFNGCGSGVSCVREDLTLDFSSLLASVTRQPPSPTPAPAILSLLMFGLAGIGIARRRKI